MNEPKEYKPPFEQAAGPPSSTPPPMGQPPRIEEVNITAETLKAEATNFPESVFMTGAVLDNVSPHILEVDRDKHLGLGNIIDSTPPYWLHLEPFHIADMMVTNGQYLQFLHYKSSELSYGGEPQQLYNTADLWHAVWSQMDLEIKSINTPVKDKDGNVVEVEESFVSALNFVHAYLMSLEHEIERMLMSIEDESSDFQTGEVKTIRRRGEKTQRFVVSKTDISSRLFSYIRFVLKGSIACQPGDEQYLLNPEERESLRHYDSPEAVVKDIDTVIRSLKPKYQQSIDKRLRDLFQQGRHDVETILFLKRFKAAFQQQPILWGPISLDRVLYPRGWPSPFGVRQRLIKVQKLVNWADLPVTGITMYEAVAFCIWLSQLTGLDVNLPNEFQFERAASWPADQGVIENGASEIRLDPNKKAIFPWEPGNRKDFNYYFGKIDSLDSYRASDYRKLLSETARKIGKQEKLKMLLGFGWQWTIDRYDDSERKYNRFQSADYPTYYGQECRLESDPDVTLKVYDYQPDRVPKNRSSFVLRGAPQIVGGPGTTTRRFAAFPLRGYKNVGFRYVFQECE